MMEVYYRVRVKIEDHAPAGLGEFYLAQVIEKALRKAPMVVEAQAERVWSAAAAGGGAK